MDIPINIIKAICENIFIELFRNKMNTRPPKTARGTVNIIIKGWTNELKDGGRDSERSPCQK